MKKTIFNLTLVLVLSLLMTSCFTYTHTIGEGPKTNVAVKSANHYLIWGLVPLDVSNPNDMAGGAKDYEVMVQHTFVNGLLNAITFGIYAPTTTTVTK